MQEHPSAAHYNDPRPCIVTMGTFDGVHLGHRSILDRVVQSGKKLGMAPVLLTFFPHPRMVLQKENNLKLINTLSEKKELLRDSGLQHLIVQPFTVAFSKLTAREYARDILRGQLRAKKVIIGYDHRFGRDRGATIKDLRAFGKSFNFEVEEIPAKEVDAVSISSTKIREAIVNGRIATATKYLGYPFMLTGKVVKGKGIGRTWGYPTANLHIEESYKLIPKNGVYLTRATLHGKQTYGLTSIGTNPTVGGKDKTIETYFLDTEINLYDKDLQIRFLKFLRGEVHFKNETLLKQAIKNDEAQARSYITAHG